MENLLLAWKEFRRGKTGKLEVQQYEFNLGGNLQSLHVQLKDGTYEHGPYQSFFVCDPKLRHIHKASIADRVVHQALFRVLYHHFDVKFIFDSYSCRLGKGTLAAVQRLEIFTRRASRNGQETVFALKCDIRKYFTSINHGILFSLIRKTIRNSEAMWLVEKIISSYSEEAGVGLPLGNVTSQLFSNIYLNELDQFVKHELKQKYYLRYCDDFIILHRCRKYLNNLIAPIKLFLHGRLKLSLHPEKITIRKLRQGIDFLGYVTLPHYRVVRTRTRRRIVRLVNCKNAPSYFGVCCHARAYNLERLILNKILPSAFLKM